VIVGTTMVTLPEENEVGRYEKRPVAANFTPIDQVLATATVTGVAAT
jgi:hypothetical protein